MGKRVKVLVIDDSALTRQIIQNGLSQYSDVDVVGVAPDVFIARDKIIFKKPDVITLDVEMPKMDGVEFLRRLMPQYPLPVVMVSALTKPNARVTLDALDYGAIDFVLKPSSSFGNHLTEMMEELHEKVLIAGKVDVSHYKKILAKPLSKISYHLKDSTDKIIAIGASTGGTVAIKQIIDTLPANSPGIVIVQHMPPQFTKMFADRLNKSSKLEVREAKGGERIYTGQVLIAPGDRHMQIKRKGGYYYVECFHAEKVNGHIPSVDILFSSVAEFGGQNSIGVILTGMGYDGARGLLEMKRNGAVTIGQNKKTCVVYGMPKEAKHLGAIDLETDITEIPNEILHAIKRISE